MLYFVFLMSYYYIVLWLFLVVPEFGLQSVIWNFLTVPRFCLQSVIVVFPDHTHLRVDYLD